MPGSWLRAANIWLLEFGETRNTAVSLAYDYDELIDISLAVYQGQGKKIDNDSRQLDWALAMEAWPSDELSFGFSDLLGNKITATNAV